jgi:hypothetical protein
MTWDFHERLAASKSMDAFTEKCLSEYFHAVDAFDTSARNTPFGHDLEVVAYGQRYKIEHKLRPTKDWGDELFEDVSNDQTGRQGWTWNCSSVDYVLYTYPTTGRWSIWPGPALELAWRKNRGLWVADYGIRSAPNPGFSTLNVPVPTAVLTSALAVCGASPCPTCGRNIGRFGSVCASCTERDCCAISDGEWICAACSGDHP